VPVAYKIKQAAFLGLLQTKMSLLIDRTKAFPFRLADAAFQRLLVPSLPAHMKLAVAANWCRITGSVEPEILYVPQLIQPQEREVALDIGANQGLCAYLFARVFGLVHAFEPNPVLAGELERLRPKNMQVWNVAVSSSTGETVSLRVPIVGKQVLHGWASLGPPNLAEVTAWQEYKSTTQTIDSLPFNSVSLIKIDVEGHEMEVLQGATRTLKKHMPWLIIEAWDQNRNAVSSHLEDLGYVRFTLRELTPHEGSVQNLIFLPRDSATRFRKSPRLFTPPS
jgi:FkbM family methyltransferase